LPHIYERHFSWWTLSPSSVGVIGNSRTCTDNLLRSLEGAGLDHLDFFQIQEDDEESWLRIQQATVVVCANVVAQRLPKLGIREDVEVIVQDRTLSKGGVEMLGRMLRRASRPTA
jgi:GntR family transcriptional regulator